MEPDEYIKVKIGDTFGTNKYRQLRKERKIKMLAHISKVKICIGGRYMTLEEIQEKTRKEKLYEKI